MRIQYKPGAAMQVDWAGNALDIYDPVADPGYSEDKREQKYPI